MIEKIKRIVEILNQLELNRLTIQGYTGDTFINPNGTLTEHYKIHFKEKKKYFYIDFGTSGAFMISKEEIKGFPIGSIFNIKGYGTPDFNKHIGNIQNIDPEFLHSKRWNYLR